MDVYLHVYTKMKDIFNATILCENCNKKALKGRIIKDGFPLRIWKCPNCNKVWYHPADMQDYQNFKKIKEKTFKVKLRLVGNSYTVSIPREIIEFQEEMQREMDDMIRIAMDGPEKLNLFFSKKIERMFK